MPVTLADGSDPGVVVDVESDGDLMFAQVAHRAPDPMPGQVWAFPGSGIERTIVDVTGGAGWFMFQPGAPFSVGGPYSCHARPEMLRIDEWPPPGGVLVSGPTPWGRDVPWAPMEGA
jgi:hypothetical protein